VLYDGRPLQELELSTLRAQIGVVTQATQLFAGTIRANIAMADPDLAQAEIERAAKLAQIHDDIMRMPAGYDTVLSTGGSSISGGQRQRVALARALARRPAILLLDEATSALDSGSEAGIQAALEDIRCTRIVIAHRLSTIARADRILVVEGGRIIEHGSPLELLARGSAYARLVAQQIGQPLPVPLPVAMARPAPSTESSAQALAEQLRRATVVVADTSPKPTCAPAVDVRPDLVITQPGLEGPAKPARRASAPALSAVRARGHDVPIVTIITCQIVGAQPDDRA
jgi:energy-coupling factor transporter ATP-binding protein EcfA2